MRGNKERQKAEDRKLVEENQHLLPPSERWAAEKLVAEDMEVDPMQVKAKVDARRKELDMDESDLDSELDEEVPKMKKKTKLRRKVGGGVEAMDVDA